jgi:hypothetical protein
MKGHVNDELERMWKEAVGPNLRHYPGICLEGPRKTSKNLRIAGLIVFFVYFIIVY